MYSFSLSPSTSNNGSASISDKTRKKIMEHSHERKVLAAADSFDPFLIHVIYVSSGVSYE